MMLTGCGSRQDGAPVSENASQTISVSDKEQREDTPETELMENGESEEAYEEVTEEPEDEELPGLGYEVLFTPVITESLDAIEHGYKDDQEYEFFSVGLMEKIMYEDRESILENVGYALIDINGDGYSELLIGYDDRDRNTSEMDSYVLDAYVLRGNTPVCMIDGIYNISHCFTTEGDGV
ncbi:hypothetical protein SAMN02910292_00220 [Lachnospiraceae bacterium XBB2008]|nr:hypothetical protein SAMN02910292_00220 [Lachnospiraceae bacterium XBB2008]